MIRLLLTSGGKLFDVTDMVLSVTWSGDYRSCSRKLEFSIVSPSRMGPMKGIDTTLGDKVQFFEDGKELFRGMVLRKKRATEGGRMDFLAVDLGIIIKRNQVSKIYRGYTPEQITRELCKEFGIPSGDIAETGATLSRNFVGTSVYDIIMTAYTLAGQGNGKAYMAGYEGGSFCVRERGIDDHTLVIASGSNLLSAAVTEDAQDMVNRVQIVNKAGNVVQTMERREDMELFGVFQQVFAEGERQEQAARKKLSDGRAKQSITIDSLGDTRSVAGRMAVLYASTAGLYGAFHIDADIHTWKDGMYTNKLTLNFEAVMDEKTAGSLEKAAAGRSGGTKKKQEESTIGFYYVPKNRKAGDVMQ